MSIGKEASQHMSTQIKVQFTPFRQLGDPWNSQRYPKTSDPQIPWKNLSCQGGWAVIWASKSWSRVATWPTHVQIPCDVLEVSQHLPTNDMNMENHEPVDEIVIVVGE